MVSSSKEAPPLKSQHHDKMTSPKAVKKKRKSNRKTTKSTPKGKKVLARGAKTLTNLKGVSEVKQGILQDNVSVQKENWGIVRKKTFGNLTQTDSKGKASIKNVCYYELSKKCTTQSLDTDICSGLRAPEGSLRTENTFPIFSTAKFLTANVKEAHKRNNSNVSSKNELYTTPSSQDELFPNDIEDGGVLIITLNEKKKTGFDNIEIQPSINSEDDERVTILAEDLLKTVNKVRHSSSVVSPLEVVINPNGRNSLLQSSKIVNKKKDEVNNVKLGKGKSIPYKIVNEYINNKYESKQTLQSAVSSKYEDALAKSLKSDKCKSCPKSVNLSIKRNTQKIKNLGTTIETSAKCSDLEEPLIKLAGITAACHSGNQKTTPDHKSNAKIRRLFGIDVKCPDRSNAKSKPNARSKSYTSFPTNPVESKANSDEVHQTDRINIIYPQGRLPQTNSLFLKSSSNNLVENNEMQDTGSMKIREAANMEDQKTNSESFQEEKSTISKINKEIGDSFFKQFHSVQRTVVKEENSTPPEIKLYNVLSKNEDQTTERTNEITTENKKKSSFCSVNEKSIEAIIEESVTPLNIKSKSTINNEEQKPAISTTDIKRRLEQIVGNLKPIKRKLQENIEPLLRTKSQIILEHNKKFKLTNTCTIDNRNISSFKSVPQSGKFGKLNEESCVLDLISVKESNSVESLLIAETPPPHSLMVRNNNRIINKFYNLKLRPGERQKPENPLSFLKEGIMFVVDDKEKGCIKAYIKITLDKHSDQDEKSIIIMSSIDNGARLGLCELPENSTLISTPSQDTICKASLGSNTSNKSSKKVYRIITTKSDPNESVKDKSSFMKNINNKLKVCRSQLLLTMKPDPVLQVTRKIFPDISENVQGNLKNNGNFFTLNKVFYNTVEVDPDCICCSEENKKNKNLDPTESEIKKDTEVKNKLDLSIAFPPLNFCRCLCSEGLERYKLKPRPYVPVTLPPPPPRKYPWDDIPQQTLKELNELDCKVSSDILVPEEVEVEEKSNQNKKRKRKVVEEVIEVISEASTVYDFSPECDVIELPEYVPPPTIERTKKSAKKSPKPCGCDCFDFPDKIISCCKRTLIPADAGITEPKPPKEEQAPLKPLPQKKKKKKPKEKVKAEVDVSAIGQNKPRPLRPCEKPVVLVRRAPIEVVEEIKVEEEPVYRFIPKVIGAKQNVNGEVQYYAVLEQIKRGNKGKFTPEYRKKKRREVPSSKKSWMGASLVDSVSGKSSAKIKW